MKCLVKSKNETGFVTVEDINLLHFLQNPSTSPKDKLPLWRFCTLKKDAPLRANQDNYDTIHMLILEIDKGYTIQAIESKASEFAYAIHTTSSHTPEVHRFRLMLPLDMDYPDSFWRENNIKRALIQKFAKFDNSTFSNYQKIPALPANPADYYYNIHKGRRFGYEDIKQIVEGLELDEHINQQFANSKNPLKLLDLTKQNSPDAYIDQHVIQKLDSINWYVDGSGRYDASTKFAGTWKSKCEQSDISAHDIWYVVQSYPMPDKYKRIIKKLLLRY